MSTRRPKSRKFADRIECAEGDSEQDDGSEDDHEPTAATSYPDVVFALIQETTLGSEGEAGQCCAIRKSIGSVFDLHMQKSSTKCKS